MKYIVLIPDFTGSCIRDEFEGEIDLESLNLPNDVFNEINNWHNAYKEIIPLSLEERKDKIEQIDKLDTEGLKIAKKLQDFIPEDVKIKYFSEGRLRYIYIK